MDKPARLEHFPISFFAMVMGLAGLTISWEKAQSTLNIPINLGVALAWFTLLVFSVLLTFFLLKLVRFNQAVKNELNHPVKLNFFPAISISLILLSVAFRHIVPSLSAGFWYVGALLHLLLTLYVMSCWIHHEKYEIHHINPAWFIPVVGNVLIPINGVHLGYIEISWFFFSIGMLFWLVLMAIIFNRVIFHNPLPAKLMPTFFILIAPPAVGFIAYMALTGELDSAARLLYYSGLFLTLLLLTQVRRFARLQFFLSWWAYSFPLAAITIASFLMYEQTQINGFALLGWALLSILTLIVVFLLYKTTLAIGRHNICLPEE